MVPLIRGGVLVDLLYLGSNKTMEPSGFILDVLKHSQRVGPEDYTVDRKVQLCSNEVAGSDCH